MSVITRSLSFCLVQAVQCLDDLIRVIDTLLMASLTKIHTELDDHVTYTRKPVKVWLSDLWDAKEEKERKENMVEGEDGEITLPNPS